MSKAKASILFLRQHWQIAAGVIMVIAAVLRIYQLGSVPNSLYWDEAAMLVDAKMVSQSGADMHGRPWYQLIYPSYGDYKLPVYIWLASASVSLFGVSNFALRLPSVIVGLLTIWIAGGITYQLLKDRTAQIFSIAMMTVSPWSVLFSRTAFEGHLGQMLLGASVWCLLAAREKRWWLIPATLAGSAATYTYFSVRFVWPVVLIATVLLWLIPSVMHAETDWKSAALKTIKHLVIAVVMPLLAFFVLLLPMTNAQFYRKSQQFRYSAQSILNSYEYVIDQNQYRLLAGNTILDRLLFHRHWLLLQQFGQNVFDHLSLNYLFITGDTNLRHGTGMHGLFLLPMIVFFGAGLFSLFKNSRWVLGILVIWWLVALVPASVPETTPHALRSLNALLPLTIIIGSGAAYLWRRYRTTAVITTLLVLVAAAQFIWFYFTQYPAISDSHWQSQYQEIAEAVIEHKDQVDSVWIQLNDRIFYLWMFGYGPYTPEQIQALPTSGFQPKEFDNVHLTEYNWDRVDDVSETILIVGKLQETLDELATYQQYLKVEYQESFISLDQKNQYLLVQIRTNEQSE